MLDNDTKSETRGEKLKYNEEFCCACNGVYADLACTEVPDIGTRLTMPTFKII
jgi:hypothetical protein